MQSPDFVRLSSTLYRLLEIHDTTRESCSGVKDQNRLCGVSVMTSVRHVTKSINNWHRNCSSLLP
jgi:hypothetical protein